MKLAARAARKKRAARAKQRNPRNSSSPPPPQGANARSSSGARGEGRSKQAPRRTQTPNAAPSRHARNLRDHPACGERSELARRGREFRQTAKRSSPKPAALLSWFDRHHRVLPWRAAPGAAADPYRVWVSEIMLQQTTVKAVTPYYLRFLAAFPSVAALAQADIEDVLKLWAGLLRARP
jgi:hypothetical protein